MKSISTVRVVAASALFTGLLAACTSMPWDRAGGRSDSGQGGTGMQGETGSGASAARFDCATFHQMESRRTPSTQQELVDQNLRGMSPDERERHMKMMREKCGPSATSPPSRY